MYLIDFIKSLARKSNIGLIIFLILNIGLVMSIFSAGFQNSGGIIVGALAYILSLAIALSPVGEWILRLQTGCKKIKNKNINERLNRLFAEVYYNAKKIESSLPTNIKLFISNDKNPNAFATGRKTICLTRGLLKYSDDKIKAIFAHELGHLAHKDTDLILIVVIGNFIVSAMFIIYRIFINVIVICLALINRSFGTLLASIFIDFILVGIMNLWTKLGVFLVMHSSRANEFSADKFAFYCGYGQELEEFLAIFEGEGKQGLWASLASTHPDAEDRADRLQELWVV